MTVWTNHHHLDPGGRTEERRPAQVRDRAGSVPGLPRGMPADIRGGDPVANAQAMRICWRVLPAPTATSWVLNAAAALVIADKTPDIAGGLALAAEALDFGPATPWTAWSGRPIRPGRTGMSDVLARICADKYAHIARQKAALRRLCRVAAALERNRTDPPRGFARRLERAVGPGSTA